MSSLAEFRCPEHGFIQLYEGPGAPLGDTQPCTICGRTMRRARAQKPPGTDRETGETDCPGCDYPGTGYHVLPDGQP